MLQSYLCDYTGAYIVVEGTITVIGANDDAYDQKIAFKNNAPFISLITRINNTLVCNAEDLDIAMPMYCNAFDLISKKSLKRHLEVSYEIITEMNQIVKQKEI